MGIMRKKATARSTKEKNTDSRNTAGTIHINKQLQSANSDRESIIVSLSETVEQLRLMADSLPVLISYVDSTYKYRFNNKAYESCFGISRDQLYGRHVKDVLGDEAYNDILAYMEAVLSGRQVSYDRSFSFRNVGERHLNVSYVPDAGRDGLIRGFFVLGYDITDRVRSEKANKLYAKRLVEVEELQKKKLTQELHDQTGRDIAALSINLNILQTLLPRKISTHALNVLDDSRMIIEEMSANIRDIMADLRPPVLDEYGLLSALSWYCSQFSKRTEIATSISGSDISPRLPHQAEICLFRIAQEAMTNVVKHAEADLITIKLEAVSSAAVRMSVSDNGKGFKLSAMSEPKNQNRWGIINMRERAEAVGGSLTVKSSPGKGTTVIAEVK